MKNFWLGLLIAACSSVWLFYKLQDRSGRNTQQSAIAAGISGAIILIVILLILGLIF
jgi:DMSO/TMAO reductase YedYZ heme-binding membrane subunit